MNKDQLKISLTKTEASDLRSLIESVGLRKLEHEATKLALQQAEYKLESMIWKLEHENCD